MKVELRGVPALARYHDVLDVCFWRLWSGSREPLPKFLRGVVFAFFLIVERAPLARSGVVPCFTQNAALYSFEHDAMLSGLSHMRSIGWPSECAPLGIISDGDCRSLAGDSFSVPLATVVQTALAMNPFAPWQAG